MGSTKHLELDLKKIAAFGEARLDENFRFRSYLKGRDSAKIDKIVHRLNAEVSEQIDCTTCGNCCSSFDPTVSKQDLEKLSEALHIPVKDVVETYTGEGPFIKGPPCTFLKDKKCTVYAHRPEVCAGYPHLHKPDFTSRTLNAIENYSVCPIVFNVMERLKAELRFR